jgi:hypothetical protein
MGLAITKSMNTENLVLRFSGKSGGKTPATLHAKNCSAVAGGSNPRKGIVVITENVAEDVADLLERKFKVKKCDCCKEVSK